MDEDIQAELLLDDDDEGGDSGVAFFMALQAEAEAIVRHYAAQPLPVREKIRRVMLLRRVAKLLEQDYRGDFSRGAMGTLKPREKTKGGEADGSQAEEEGRGQEALLT